MKIKVEVMSRKAFEEYAAMSHRDRAIVISITSYREPFISSKLLRNVNNGIQDVYKVIFNDVDDIQYGMNQVQAIEMAYFVSSRISEVDKIIVHCGAGQSRSAGVAAAILKHYTNDDTQIFDNKKYTPNMRCYRLMLEALNLGVKCN